MNSGKNPTINNENKMISFRELKKDIFDISEKLDLLYERVNFLISILLLEEESELVKYLQETMDAVILLDRKKNGIPISRHDLAEELDIHPNTAYIRAEKLVKMKKLHKFYGRELGRIMFKEKKAVYYGLFRTLYHRSYLEELEKKNDIAYRIAVTLLQQQPLSEQELFKDSSISRSEIKNGFRYLLDRGLILLDMKEDVAQYRIRKIEAKPEK